jgi:hypothetical protein
MTAENKPLLQANISLALRDELRRQPTETGRACFPLAARVPPKAVLRLHFERNVQKQKGELALF